MNQFRVRKNVIAFAIGLISCCLVKSVLVAFNIETYDSSDHFFEETVEKAPEKHLQRAYSLMIIKGPRPIVERKNVLEAIEECNMALKLKPDYARAYGARASAFDMLNQRKDALRDCDIAIKLDSQNPYRYLARSIYNGLSINELNRAIELDPRECFFFLLRGDSKCLDKDYIGAMLDYVKYLRLSKSNCRFQDCAQNFWEYSHSTRENELKPHDWVQG